MSIAFPYAIEASTAIRDKIMDGSTWQGDINWDLLAPQLLGCWHRLTVGDYYIDTRFYTNWRQMQEREVPAGVYHVIRPDIDPAKQVEKIVNAFGDRVAQLPLVLDCEINPQNKTKTEVAANILSVADRLLTYGWKRVMIYTSKSWWESNVARSTGWQKTFDLWVANYGVSAPAVPIDWKDNGWKLWQYTSKGWLAGIPAGTQVDLNNFCGTAQEFLDYYGLAGGETPPPLPARVRTNVVCNLRNVADPAFPAASDVGDLEAGAEFEYLGEDQVFYKIGAYVAKSVATVL